MAAFKQGPPSRQKFKCLVCTKEFRSDKLKHHYLKYVQFTDSGEPVSAIELQNIRDESVREHTQYFAAHGYTSNNFPKTNKHKRVGIPENPFEASKPAAKRKASHQDEDVPHTESSADSIPEHVEAGSSHQSYIQTETEFAHHKCTRCNVKCT